MHVASRPISAPVALLERPVTRNGKTHCQRILVFREGLLSKPVLSLLGRLLEPL